MKINELKQNYENACNAYLKAFCEKHEFDYEDAKDNWVGGDVGEITTCADYFVTMTTIIADIELSANEADFMQWYDYCGDMYFLGAETTPNYKSWLLGCPRKSAQEIERLKRNKKRLEDLMEGLKNEINN